MSSQFTAECLTVAAVTMPILYNDTKGTRVNTDQTVNAYKGLAALKQAYQVERLSAYPRRLKAAGISNINEGCDTYLSHETVSASAFLVFEDNVRVVIGYELLESRIVTRDFAFGQSTSAERVLRYVGHVLLENERRQLARRPSAISAPAGTAGRRRGRQ